MFCGCHKYSDTDSRQASPTATHRDFDGPPLVLKREVNGLQRGVYVATVYVANECCCVP